MSGIQRDLLDVKPAPPGHCISLWNCEKYLEYSSWIRLLYKYSVRTAGPAALFPQLRDTKASSGKVNGGRKAFGLVVAVVQNDR